MRSVKQLEELSIIEGHGLETVSVTDRDFWRRNQDFVLLQVIQAIEAIDNPRLARARYGYGPSQAEANLTALLAEAQPLCNEARFHLADLKTRRLASQNRGRPPCPSYDLPPRQRMLGVASMDITELMKTGQSLQEAVTTVAPKYDFTIDQLLLYRRGSLGSTNRSRKRRPKAEHS